MTTSDRVRLDKWLWAARFFKTRSLAAEAVDGGKVHVNGARVRRAREVRMGDAVRVRTGPYEYDVVVRGLSDRRGPAAAARELFDETADSAAAREKLRAQLSLVPAAFIPGKGRPTKRDRRALKKFRDRT
jgi:ribosome-associated heat shock protein Hsp15